MEETTKNGNQNLNGNRRPMNMLDALTRLKNVGMPSEQAEEVVRMQYDLVESNLATKKDLKNLEDKIGLKMIITSGSFAFLILGALVTLAKLGLLAPPVGN